MVLNLFPAGKIMIMLTVSFFVLIAAAKTDSRRLKQFGRIIAMSLWIIAAAIYLDATYSNLTGKETCSFDKSMFSNKMHHHKKMPIK